MACEAGEAEEGPLPACIVSDYKPSSDCICKRPDCFYEFLRAGTKNGKKRAKKTCHSCKEVGGSDQRWYPVSPGDGCGEGKWRCHACYKLELAKRKESTTTETSGPAVILLDPPLQRPEEIVRKEVESSVAGGNIVYWEDVYPRLARVCSPNLFSRRRMGCGR